MGARIIVEVTEGPRPELRLRAPFYKRAIAVSDIASLTYNHEGLPRVWLTSDLWSRDGLLEGWPHARCIPPRVPPRRGRDRP